ncbi:glycoside hydrolase family 25 protein [Viridibacillus sp. YIM B01967]|uniref:Glycoside hydrolase family 25 protein n=1 Tax=Viridibacillus soli TaxID=2798301 RepID=A0ABS1H2B5_9BACL|nr:DUF5776 domain-containing protein [Viridibacillus soli]MBK3493555.1 glycoside hydrolase family 25 protein [Viridibacillus soli]
MKKLRYLTTLLCLVAVFLVAAQTISADELGPANPDSKTKWETESEVKDKFNLKVKSAEPVIADISKWQGTIDWATASKVLDLVIIRTQYGSILEDTKHKEYEAGALKYGVPFGVYSYSLAESTADAKAEANTFYNRASKDANFYVLDVEEFTSTSGESMREIINAYVKQLRTKTDKKIGVYIAHHLYNQLNIDTSKFDFVWIPRYNNTNTVPDFKYNLWQYTDKGIVPGISTYVDLNRLNPNTPLNYFTDAADVETANKATYYTTNPKKIVVKKKVYQYSSTSLTAEYRGAALSKNTVVNVSGIEKTSKGTPRLKLTNGKYITANKEFVLKLTSSIDQYYTTVPKKVLIKKGLNAYSSTNLTTSNKLTGVKKNSVLTINDIAYSTGGTPRLKTISGSYITAKKNYVLPLTSSIENYIYTNPGSIKTKSTVYQYRSTNFTTSNKGKAITKGSTVKVSSIVFTSKGTPRLKLSNGMYITANKSYVVAK